LQYFGNAAPVTYPCTEAGSRLLAMGSIFGQPHCSERGYGVTGGALDRRCTVNKVGRSATRILPPFLPLFCSGSGSGSSPLSYLLSSTGGQCCPTCLIGSSLPFASRKGCRRDYLDIGQRFQCGSWIVERGATALSFARRDALKINAKDAKIRVSGLDQKAEINPSHLHTVAAARAEQILDANAMQTRGTLASASIGRDDRGLDSSSGALPAAKRGALPIVDPWSIPIL
jgi:hypothetical protein